jgi:hypothetical protein
LEATVALAVFLQHMNFELVPDQNIGMTTGATIHTTNVRLSTFFFFDICFSTSGFFSLSYSLAPIFYALQVSLFKSSFFLSKVEEKYS